MGLLSSLKHAMGFSRPDDLRRHSDAGASTAPTPPLSRATSGNQGDSTLRPVRELREIIRVEEVTDARFFVNDLFKRRFGSDAPDYPRHFVVFHKPSPGHFTAVGYIHYSPFEDSWLCGGMVMDDRVYRKLPPSDRAMIKAAGGIAEIMLRDTFLRFPDAPAIWGYVGVKLAEVVDLRAGFVHTGVRHVMVVWNRDMPMDEKASRLEKVVALGPF